MNRNIRHRKPQGQRAVPVSVSLPLDVKLWTETYARANNLRGVSDVVQKAVTHYRLTLDHAA